MIKKMFFIYVFFASLLKAQVGKTIYFDKSWKETTKEKASFYRIQEKTKNDSIIYNQDFYANGNLQNQWYSLKNDINSIIGSAYWYDENGFDTKMTFQYPNSWKDNDIENIKGIELTFHYHNGKIWNIQTLLGYTHLDKIYDESGNIFQKIQYKDRYEVVNIGYGNLIFSGGQVDRFFWKNTLKLAQEKFYKDNRLILIKDYNEKEELINEVNSDNILDNMVFRHKVFDYKFKQGFADKVQELKSPEIIIGQVVNYKNAEWIIAGQDFGIFTKYQNQYKSINDRYEVSDEKEKYRGYTEIREDNSIYSKQEIINIIKKDGKLFNISDIKSQNIKNLQKSVQGKVFTFFDKQNNLQYKAFFISPEIFIKQTYRYGNNENNKGIGTFIVKDDDKEKKWRLEYSESNIVFIINLNNKKPFFYFSSDARSSKTLLITGKGVYLDNELFTESDEKIEYESVYNYLNTDYFYSAVKKNDKYNLYSIFGTKLLDKDYDNIKTENNFIVLQNKNEKEILNFKLDKFKINNIKAYYINGNYINVLHNNTAENLDFSGNKPLTFKTVMYECGSGRCNHNDEFVRKENDENWSLFSSVSCNRDTVVNKISFENISINERPSLIPVLNNGFDYTKDFIKKYNEDYGSWFIIKQNGKFGLFTYNNKTLKNSQKEKLPDVEENEDINNTDQKLVKNSKKNKIITTEIEPVILVSFSYKKNTNNITNDSKTEAIELLPAEYDEIKYTEDESLITFRKNDLYGIFLYNQVPKYKKIGLRVGNFIEITDRNSKNGWLDLATNREYYNN